MVVSLKHIIQPASVLFYSDDFYKIQRKFDDFNFKPYLVRVGFIVYDTINVLLCRAILKIFDICI